MGTSTPPVPDSASPPTTRRRPSYSSRPPRFPSPNGRARYPSLFPLSLPSPLTRAAAPSKPLRFPIPLPLPLPLRWPLLTTATTVSTNANTALGLLRNPRCPSCSLGVHPSTALLRPSARESPPVELIAPTSTTTTTLMLRIASAAVPEREAEDAAARISRWRTSTPRRVAAGCGAHSLCACKW